jgi:hypothetical protein
MGASQQSAIGSQNQKSEIKSFDYSFIDLRANSRSSVSDSRFQISDCQSAMI